MRDVGAPGSARATRCHYPLVPALRRCSVMESDASLADGTIAGAAAAGRGAGRAARACRSASSSRSTSRRRSATLLGAGLRDEVVHAVDRVVAAHRAGRGRRARRRVRLRQVDARPARRRAAAAVRRRALLARHAARRRCRRRSAREHPAADADDLPGPVRVAESAHARRRHRRRGAGRARPHQRRARRSSTSACSSIASGSTRR